MPAAKPNEAPVVAVLNMKGGVGKTTISAHVFRHLYLRLSKSTLLIDFDPQFNLTQTVIARADYEQYKAHKRTILSVMEPSQVNSIFQVNSTPGPPPTEDEVSVMLKHVRGNPSINLALVPGDFGLVKYSLIDNQSSLLPIRKRFLQFIDDTRKTRDLICIDCNPSSSFMTLCALLACTHILVPVRPDRYSILGLELLDQFVNELALLTVKPKLIVILNGVPTSGYDPTVENSLRSHPRFGPVTVAQNLTISKILEATPGYTGFATDKKVPHRWSLSTKIDAITNELGSRLGLT